jgi:hypothetical protein
MPLVIEQLLLILFNQRTNYSWENERLGTVQKTHEIFSGEGVGPPPSKNNHTM